MFTAQTLRKQAGFAIFLVKLLSTSFVLTANASPLLLPPTAAGPNLPVTTTTYSSTSSSFPETVTPVVIVLKDDANSGNVSSFNSSLASNGATDIEPSTDENDNGSAVLQATSQSSPGILVRGRSRINGRAPTPPPDTHVQTIVGNSDYDHLARLSRSDSRTDKDDFYNDYVYPTSGGQGVTIYFIDTGLNMDHEEVAEAKKEGRVQLMETTGERDNKLDPLRLTPFVPDKNVVDRADDDPRGHGSCVWQFAAGANFGTAKKVNTIMVREQSMYDADENIWRSSLASPLKAISAVAKDITEKRLGSKAIVNFSGTIPDGATQFYLKRFQEIADTGALVVASAGNSGKDADTKKAEVAIGKRQLKEKFSNVLLVGSVNNADQKSTFSSKEPAALTGLAKDLGRYVDVYARADGLKCIDKSKSTGLNSDPGGTSYAAPQLSGIAAAIMSQPNAPKSAKELADKLRLLAWKRAGQDDKVRVAYNGVFGDNCDSANTNQKRAGGGSCINKSKAAASATSKSGAAASATSKSKAAASATSKSKAAASATSKSKAAASATSKSKAAASATSKSGAAASATSKSKAGASATSKAKAAPSAARA